MKNLGKELRNNGVTMSIHNNKFIFFKKGVSRMYEIDELMIEKSTEAELENILLKYLRMFLNSFEL